jgi:hypothetical protein
MELELGVAATIAELDGELVRESASVERKSRVGENDDDDDEDDEEGNSADMDDEDKNEDEDDGVARA